MNPLLDTALRAARAAASVHVTWAGRLTIEGATRKGISDFVSQADFEAQTAAIEIIRERHPDHAIMAEEGGEGVLGETGLVDSTGVHGPLPSFTWVIDPLDGTANFLHGHPMYAASVGVAENGRSVAGAVVCSTSGEEWWASRGEGAWKKERGKEAARISVSNATSYAGGLVGTGFPFKSQHLIPEYVEQLARVLRAGSGVRRGGAAAIDLCYLAEGRFDGFWELFLNPWDFAAGMVIIEEAGGVVSRVEGSPLELAPGDVMGACSPDMLRLLGDVVHGRAAASAKVAAAGAAAT